MLLGYKQWNIGVLCLAGGLSGVSAALLSVYYYQFYKLGITYSIIQVIVTGVSGIILAGVFPKFLADKIAKTGAFNQFKIAYGK
ncbi:MAG: hypothetical protein K2P99_01540 [Burkholderiales bacterium]|nr:hypothetical protein [Burkholderiales bacterium]